MHCSTDATDDPPPGAPRRGRLKIFFGVSSRVGKTCAMLARARALRERGVDVVVGVVETHERAAVAALAAGLPSIAPRQLGDGRWSFPEFDVDAVLARRPALVVVDELAHANVAGARHPKRWQDVQALRAAGIDVWTTLNVQHVESLVDAVDGIAGLRRGETVPDAMFDDADEIAIVDLSPDALLRRLKAFPIQVPVSVSVPAAPGARRGAGKPLLRKGDLLALRELALRRTADRREVEMIDGAEPLVAPTAARLSSPHADGAAPIAGDPGRPGAATSGDGAAIAPPSRALHAYAESAALCAGVTLVTTPLLGLFDLSNVVMLFLLVVVVVAVRHGRGPAVFAAFLGVAAFDFFDVPPRLTFAIGNLRYLLTFVVMLVVALVIGQLAAGLTRQARVAARREDRVRALYELSRDLAAALMPAQIVEIGTRVLQAQFQARAIFLLPDAHDRLVVAPSGTAPPPIDLGLAHWALAQAEAAGQGTLISPASRMRYVPMKAPMRVRGVVALALPDAQRLLASEQRRLLDTTASLLAIALERIHYVEVAQQTTVQMESERLRNALLGAISHDLRTPLAALAGMADSLRLTAPPLAPEHADIAQALREAALRMNALVGNLLEMARLESGRIALNPQWQPLEEVIGSTLRGLGGPFAGSHPMKVRLPADLPLVQIDAVLIERVLANLLENAAKYTPPGSAITIGAMASPRTVDIWVDDDGPGLPPGREELIFEKFERGRKESATPGVGLGLAICRAIVAAHGGTIRGLTRAEGGARFVFTLPRGEPPILDEAEAIDQGEAVDDGPDGFGSGRGGDNAVAAGGAPVLPVAIDLVAGAASPGRAPDGERPNDAH